MSLNHCDIHLSWAHDCPDCHALNPTTGVESLQTENDINRDPYNYFGPQMQPDQFTMGIDFARNLIADSETVFYTRGLNWFQRFMISRLFGWKVINE